MSAINLYKEEEDGTYMLDIFSHLAVLLILERHLPHLLVPCAVLLQSLEIHVS
jgi:hypothetical protein